MPELLEYDCKKQALVFYADESLISLIPYVGLTWTFPKVEVTTRVSGKRGQSVGVTAAVNPQGRLCFEMTKEKEKEKEIFTAKVFIRFIKKLRKETKGRNIVLIYRFHFKKSEKNEEPVYPLRSKVPEGTNKYPFQQIESSDILDWNGYI